MPTAPPLLLLFSSSPFSFSAPRIGASSSNSISSSTSLSTFSSPAPAFPPFFPNLSSTPASSDMLREWLAFSLTSEKVWLCCGLLQVHWITTAIAHHNFNTPPSKNVLPLYFR
ncbi:hypothetical protein OnM2_03340 [Erysiphe neolycopersici]|uniref:Uncharacterized protein n=1 Tax=Erysiphe neolycopersici TaxID=212602 RepID=A0A420HUW1_9PEZI|nr:hypothetical protein OnM2_03340 [Erysiphe neolycopersici]